MALTIRGISGEELPSFLEAMATPFAFDLTDEETEHERFSAIIETERARCAFDGDTMVGTLGSFSFDMTVPGGETSCAGTTMVTVQPTHRRRGLLRQMIRAHFDDAMERGESIASLYASDSAIYGRFGYGLASVHAQVTVSRAHVSFHRLAPEPLPVRMIEDAEAREVLPGLFEAVRQRRPGAFARSDAWWSHRRFRDEPDQRGGATAFRYAVAEGPDGPEGYVQYRLKQGWTDHHGDHTVRVRELVSLTPAAASALWNLVLTHDLAGTIEAHDLPVDEPLFDLLAAVRRAAPTLTDQLWVRVLDIPAALSARRYPVEGSLVFEVHDSFGDASGAYRLTGGPDGADCIRSTDPADIALDVEDLGACYLGRARFGALARAGRLTGSAEALRTADLMFTWDPAPWCQEVF